MKHYSVSLGFINADHELYTREKPFYSNMPFTKTPGARSTNVESVNQDVEIADIRGFEDLFSLDQNGFELVKHETAFNSWFDGERTVKMHYPEMEEFLRVRLGADEVVIFDHTLRSSGRPRTSDQDGQVKGKTDIATPSRTAHVDSTSNATVESIKKDFGGRAEQLLKGRFQIVNIWRPLVEPIQQQPLVLCDYRTAVNDVVGTDLVFPHTVTEIYTVGYSVAQCWYFVDQQMKDEVWLIKIMDSAAEADPNIAKFTPHTSFNHPGAPPTAQPRASIELRAYVFTYPK